MAKHISIGDPVSVDQEGKVIPCNEDDPFVMGHVVSLNEDEGTINVSIGQTVSEVVSGATRIDAFEKPKPKPKRNRFEMLEI